MVITVPNLKATRLFGHWLILAWIEKILSAFIGIICNSYYAKCHTGDAGLEWRGYWRSSLSEFTIVH
ncbi:hypothetical protein N431DRAFT_134786 [Stipitochalara longipes BDJ]|nr:hypothetical protein N431DRAFT_134786 [Stipitochalara longipes BDJ]